MISWIKDTILELRIALELHRLLRSIDRIQMRVHAKRMADLCRQRSPRRIEQMERKAGLR